MAFQIIINIIPTNKIKLSFLIILDILISYRGDIPNAY